MIPVLRFKERKMKNVYLLSNKKLLLEKRTSSIIRTVAKECINNSEEEIDINKLVKQVKEIILVYGTGVVVARLFPTQSVGVRFLCAMLFFSLDLFIEDVRVTDS